MEKFIVCYHIVGDKVIVDTSEFNSFEEAVTSVSARLKKEVIGIVKNKRHVIEIQTKYITFHEVMSKEQYRNRLELDRLNNLVKSS